jgi:predicted transport protein
LLITDDTIQQLPEIMQVYYESWGKLIKPFVLRKFSINKETLCSLHPDFADIDKGKVNIKIRVLKSTEDDHLKDVEDSVRDTYTLIKEGLLKADKSVEFNPKQYYVSIRKNRNLAFMHIGKKRISLVVVNPEEETRKAIKHHEIKTLTEKVQKFWNGPSCTIIIDTADKLNEVTNLLKKLVAKS